MKIRISFLITMLLVLPLILAACGGGDTDTAKKFVEALADGDKDKMEDLVCEDQKDEVSDEALSKFEAKDLKCEEDGDDIKCTFKSDLGGLDEETKIVMVFEMKDGKVCDIKSMDTPDLDSAEE
jgi:hypothetical protein